MGVVDVRHRYEKLKALQTNDISLRGWMFDILNCINDIGTENFTLQQVYRYADVLKVKHRLNRNIEAKIRQQLQFLRDKGFIEFVARGTYRKVI